MTSTNDSINKFREQQVQIQKALESPFKQMFEMQEQIRMSFQNPSVQKLLEDQERIRKLLASQFQPIIEHQKILQVILKPISIILREAAHDYEQYKVLMVKLGFPPHYDMDYTEMMDVHNYYEQYGEEATKIYIEKKVESMFPNEKISEYLNSWKSINWLTYRKQILEEAIHNHIEGRFFSSISTLLPQIEGVIIDKTNSTGWISQQKLKQLMESILIEESVFSLDDVLKIFYFELVLDSFTHGQVIKSPLSRHAILHGADTNFGYKINSLRCILLFDYLIYKLEGKK